jgi:uncharacterized protein (TIGR02246 family)
MTHDERAIRSVIETWMTATRSGDTATVLSLMTDDAVFLTPGREPFGKEVFAAASADMQGISTDGNSEVVELKVLGDWAFARSHIAVIMTRPGAAPIRRSGYALTLFQKGADGKWRLARDANLLTDDKAAEQA